MNSVDNLRFDKESYFVFYGLFYKKVEHFFPRVPIRCRNTCKSLGELNFSLSQTSTRVSITVWKQGKCFLYILNIKIVHIITIYILLSYIYIITIYILLPYIYYYYYLDRTIIKMQFPIWSSCFLSTVEVGHLGIVYFFVVICFCVI